MGISYPPTGMTSASFALRYWERRQEVAANNLANVSTDGFKGERAFARLVEGALPEIGAATDLRAGPLTPTESPLDLALAGDGFFVVRTPEGERYTRGGALRFDDQHRLVDGGGNPLLGEDGAIVALPGELVPEQTDPGMPAATGGAGNALLQIDRTGRVQLAGRTVAQLRVERLAPGAQATHAGHNLFVPPAEGRLNVALEDREVRQGMLEGSNVNSVSALVDMISIQRAYASVQKAVTTLDGIRGVLTNEIGKPS